MRNRHEHGHEHASDERQGEQGEETNAEITEDDFMKAIDEAASRHDVQRAFWDDQLKQMNRWANL
eukprot:gene11249-12429_t